MNTYYEMKGTIDGEEHTLFGSFDKSDVTYELDVERSNYKADGYKKLRIVKVETVEEADAAVYDNTMTSEAFFKKHAPDFNFEFDSTELIEVALEKGFISKAGANSYIYTDTDIDSI
jgi:hypothetical protein|tara:strand:- start:455 stop:805 length:351 start_codon:yes stop_codon:yes gene_type:complete